MRNDHMGRVEYVDVAKGIGIICVMLGHLGIEMIDRIVYPFHMPLFFWLSGYFLNDKMIFSEFVKNKAKRLIFPYYVTGGIVCVLTVLADVVRGLRDDILPDFLSNFVAMLYGSCFDVSEYIKGIGAIWFLWALFWSLMVVKILEKYKYCPVYIMLIAVISFMLSKWEIRLPLSIQSGTSASIFVYLGFILSKMNMGKDFNNVRLALISLVVYAMEILFDIRVNISNNTYDYGIVSVIGALFACCFVLHISKIICLVIPKVSKIFMFFGRYSLIILCVHYIEMKVFPWSLVLYALERAGLTAWFSLAVIVIRIALCAGCTLAILWIKQSKYCSKL